MALAQCLVYDVKTGWGPPCEGPSLPTPAPAPAPPPRWPRQLHTILPEDILHAVRNSRPENGDQFHKVDDWLAKNNGESYINATDQYGRSLLHLFACDMIDENDDVDRARRLLERNADANHSCPGYRPLHCAARGFGFAAPAMFSCLIAAGADLDRDLHGLFIFFVGVVLFRVAAAVDLLTDLLVPATPVVVLASGVAVSGLAPHTFRGVVGQRGGAGGAGCEKHIAFELLAVVARQIETRLTRVKNPYTAFKRRDSPPLGVLNSSVPRIK